MLNVIREFVTALPTKEEENVFSSSLSGQYTSLLGTAHGQACQLLGIPPSECLPVSHFGEIYLSKDSKDKKLFYYTKFSSGLEIGTIGETDVAQEHGRFVQSILTHLKGAPEKRPIRSANRTFASLYQEYGDFSASDEDRQATALLRNHAARDFLGSILTSGRREYTDSHPEIPTETISALEKAGMIKREFLIICRQSGNEIMMVESIEAVEEASKQGFKCFACGRPFPEEKQTQFISPTFYGQRMMSGNRWLLVDLWEALEKLPTPKTLCVMTEGEISTLFLNIETSLVMIEVKETPYLPKDAYLLKKKQAIYKPAASFLLLLSPPSKTASEFLDLEKNNEELWIGKSNEELWIGKSTEDLVRKFPSLIEKAHKAFIREVFQRFTELSTLPLSELILSHFFSLNVVIPKLPQFEPPVLQEKPQVEELIAPPKPSEPTVDTPSQAPAHINQPIMNSQPRLSKDKLVQKILDEVSRGVVGRESSLHILLQDLSDLNRRWKACLLSEDGLAIASTLPEDTSEILASYGSECFGIAQSILAKHNLSPLSTLTMASKNFAVEFYHVPGFYFAVASTLETTVAEQIANAGVSEGLKVTCDRLLEKKLVRAVELLNQKGTTIKDSAKSPNGSLPFGALLELFPKLASRFGPIGQGNLESIAVRVPSANIVLCLAGSGYIASACEPEQLWEDLIPYLLALGTEASRFFDPVKA